MIISTIYLIVAKGGQTMVQGLVGVGDGMWEDGYTRIIGIYHDVIVGRGNWCTNIVGI